MPITWRNVDGPNLAQAAVPLAYAGRSFENTFDVLGKALAERQQANQVAEDRGLDAAKTNYLSLLQSFKTPEALAAAQQNGTIQRAFAALDPTRQAQVLGADERRLVDARNLVTQGQQYGDAQLDRTQQPIRDQIASDIASGDPIRIAAARTKLGEVSLRNEAALEADALTAERGGIRFGNEQAGEKRAQASHTSRLTTDALQQKDARLGIQEKELSIADRAEARKLDTVVQARVNQYQTDQATVKTALGSVAAKNGLRVDPAGFPDINNYSDDEKTKLDELTTAAGLPKASTVFSGDTKAGNDLFQELSNSGFSQRLLGANRNSILGAFDTSRQGARVGNDLASFNRAVAQADIAQRQKDANNWMAAGDATARTAYDDLAKEVPNLIDKSSGWSPEQDIPAVQNLVYELSTRGVEVTKPKTENGKTIPGEYFVPPPELVRAAIRQATTSKWYNWTDAARAEKIRDWLVEQSKSKDITQMRADALESQRAANIRALNEALLPRK